MVGYRMFAPTETLLIIADCACCNILLSTTWNNKVQESRRLVLV